MTDTSQYGEGRFIADHFAGRIGRFLDVGAFDGRTFSNTWRLAELGWSGVCVEPSPPAFCALMRNHWDNPKIELVNAALVVNQNYGLFPFFCNTPDGFAADALSTFETRHRDKFAVAGHPFREIQIPMIGWQDLRGEYDLVNIDTEGTNAEVLSVMPMRPEMVCVEYDPDADGVNTVHNILTGWGYRITVIGGNVLGVRS